jgi:DNA mismatch repair protein MutS2
MVHDTSGSGATVFIEPAAVVEANNEIKVLESREQDEIEKILAELSQMAGEFEDTIKISFESAVMLDLIFAKAHLAYKMKATLPNINNNVPDNTAISIISTALIVPSISLNTPGQRISLG